MVGFLKQAATFAADACAQTLPAKRPSRERLLRARIVAHRGAHGIGARENTVAAFDRAAAAGVWGIELDVRFTRDHEPVICHDADLRRTFGVAATIADCTRAELARVAPDVPALEEIVARYGGNVQLMIELKRNGLPSARGVSRFTDALKPLEPQRDFRMLALHEEVFDRVTFAPPPALALVSELAPWRTARIAIARGWGAACGHYALVSDRVRRDLRDHDCSVGVGHVASRSCLTREIARGADWLFTNHAERAQGWLTDLQIEAGIKAP